MGRILKYLGQVIFRLVNRGTYREDFLRQLPAEFHEAANLAFWGKRSLSAQERVIGSNIESFRSDIPRLYTEAEIESYTSPHSNTFELKSESDHANPGPWRRSKTENTMKTGSGILKGLLLRRIVAGTGAKRVLELGTNTGFSGSYFLSVNNLKLTTVEGSSALCQIADRNMSRISDNYQIHNCLFDEAIDRLTMENEKFDCVFLDGQHEREATLHYAKRLKPLMSEGAIYIFDDIYWSDDMNQAWKDLTLLEGFSHSVDFLTLGVLRQHTLSPRARPHDLGNFIPRPPIFRKGW